MVPWTGVENAIATGNTNVKSFIIYRAILRRISQTDDLAVVSRICLAGNVKLNAV